MKNKIPDLLLSRLAQIFGAARAREIARTFVERPTTFRVNTLKAEVDEVLRDLSREGFKIQRVPWSRTAFVLMNRSQRELTKLSLFGDGLIYLQSLASQVPPIILDPKPGERVLDMTAAPGSKTSQIAALMGNKGRFTAWEKDKIRFERLAHNMGLLGIDCVNFLELKRGDALELATGTENAQAFDRILLDAPCSAEVRIIESDHRTYGFWSEDKIRSNAKLQRDLLAAAWVMLKPGGTLVYSTCTFAPEENECVVQGLMKSVPTVVGGIPAIKGLNALGGIKSWNGESTEQAARCSMRIVPTDTTEGFFVAVIKKA